MLKTIKPECLDKECYDKIITFKDRKGGRSKYIAENDKQKKVEKYNIDDNLIIEGNKCDNGLWVCDDGVLYLIELKGSDLVHACVQILATIEFLKSRIRLPILNARIVLSRVSGPDLKDATYIKLSREMRLYGGCLKKESVEMKEKI